MALFQKIFRKEINSPFPLSFDLAVLGFYAITVRASCKPGWRNKWWLKFKEFFEETLDFHLDDGDLRIEIDDRQFGKPGGRRGLFNSPAAFSGTKTLGKTKTVVFLIRLSQGNHQIEFIPQRSAYLEEVSVEEIVDPENVEFHPEAKAEDENFYSWNTFVLVEQPLKSLSVVAQADVLIPGNDDDDLKLVVDGQVRQNHLNRHQQSYFCGFFLKGKEDRYTEDLSLETDVHYLELFADKTPTLHSVKFVLSSSNSGIPKTGIKVYLPGPKGEDFNRFDETIREAVAFWNTDFLSQSYPPPQPLDPNLVKAMIYVESLMGYGSGQSADSDVMQVGNKNDPAIHTLNNDGWVDPRTGKVSREYEWQVNREAVLDYQGKAGAETPEQSIRWGTRWLYHKAQGIGDGKRYWRSWERAVEGYNGGGNPNYLKEVYGVYRNGINPQGKKLWSILLLVFSVLSVSALTVHLWLDRRPHLATKVRPTTQVSMGNSRGGSILSEATRPVFSFKIKEEERLDSENRLALIWHTVYPAIGLGIVDNFGKVKYFLEGNELKEEVPGGEIDGPGEYVKWLEVGDFDGDKRKEIAVQYIVSGSGLFRPFYVYKEKGDSFRLLLRRNDGVSEAQLVDLDHDGKKEILYSYSLDASGAGPRTWTAWREIWGWYEGELEMVSHKYPSVYKNLILFYDHLLTDPAPDFWLKSYYPMIVCLKARANEDVSGTLADVKTCLRSNTEI